MGHQRLRLGHLDAAGYGASVGYVFVTALHSNALGALLTFAPSVIYRPYQVARPGGLSALGDQQLASPAGRSGQRHAGDGRHRS